jgi:hypothetical protein
MQMPSFPRVKTVTAILCALALSMVACGPPDEASRAVAGPVVGPFVVSNFFVPSGLMGEGSIPDQLTVDINTNCRPRPAGAQGDCYRFTWHVNNTFKWAGAYWVYPANSWGTVPGRELVGRIDYGPDPKGGAELTGYQHVRFSAAIEDASDPTNPHKPLMKPVGLSFFAGGIDGGMAMPIKRPYSDHWCSFFPPDPGMPQSPPSCDVTNDFPIAQEDVGFDWSTHLLVMDGSDPNKLNGIKYALHGPIIGGFGWSMNNDANMVSTVVLYIDGIVWE